MGDTSTIWQICNIPLQKNPANHIIFIIITDNDNDNVMKSILKGFPSGGPQIYLCNEHIYAN